MMTEYTFFEGRVERWRGIWLPYGVTSLCAPHLDQLDLPHHLPMDLASVSSFKVWGDI